MLNWTISFSQQLQDFFVFVFFFLIKIPTQKIKPNGKNRASIVKNEAFFRNESVTTHEKIVGVAFYIKLQCCYLESWQINPIISYILLYIQQNSFIISYPTLSYPISYHLYLERKIIKTKFKNKKLNRFINKYRLM